ncbi:hypothetical protein AB0J77_14495 [Micromonospora tulbaghiae]|uniref:hypothetical protein n=1 Tax=Micromonospora tulbaghiae TaxID=479978 RepID=UPI003425A4C4
MSPADRAVDSAGRCRIKDNTCSTSRPWLAYEQPAPTRPLRVIDVYREAHASGDPAQLLRAAILAMAVRYATAASDHGFACVDGTAAARAHAIRAMKRRRLALERLTAALAALTGGAR